MEKDISNLIRQFSLDFKSEALKPYRGTRNAQIITHIIPEILKEKLDLNESYRVYGSVGSGQWAEIPWFAILDKSITDSTTYGYYVAILFNKNLKAVHLMLAVGWTQFESEYGKEAAQKIKETCFYYSKQLKTAVGFTDGPIDLGAVNALGKGYEAGAILSKKYLVRDISEEILIKDIKHLLTSYEELKSIVGNSILNLVIDTTAYDKKINSFKEKVAIKSLSHDTLQTMDELIKLANKEPPKIREVLIRQIVRNRKYSDAVKMRAGFICQICGKEPFIQKNGQPYAEADHIIPLGGKHRGIDSPENMRCTCPQCHAIITYGSKKEINKLGYE